MFYDERQSISEFIRNLEFNFNELEILGIKTSYKKKQKFYLKPYLKSSKNKIYQTTRTWRIVQNIQSR